MVRRRKNNLRRASQKKNKDADSSSNQNQGPAIGHQILQANLRLSSHIKLLKNRAILIFKPVLSKKEGLLQEKKPLPACPRLALIIQGRFVSTKWLRKIQPKEY